MNNIKTIKNMLCGIVFVASAVSFFIAEAHQFPYLLIAILSLACISDAKGEQDV
jgi:hypothetical protein